MGILTAFKLSFQSPLHLGSTRADYDNSETIQHSDTLYAALVSACFTLGLQEKKHELIDEAGALKGITLSSLYPFSQQEGKVSYFFPIPFDTVEAAEQGFKKKLKKSRFLDQYYFNRIQSRGKQRIPKTAIKGKFVSSIPDFDENFMVRKVFPRARVPRSGHTSETIIYYIERIFFRPGSGLYGIALVEDELAKKRLLALLSFLGDEGIGTDRHVGHGQFKVEEAIDFDWNSLFSVQSRYQTNLSLFLPENKEQLNTYLDERSSYKLIKRGGWITTPSYLTFRKQSIHMFQEGGVFSCTEQIAGRTVNLVPTNLPGDKEVGIPVYRSGISLFVPIKFS